MQLKLINPSVQVFWLCSEYLQWLFGLENLRLAIGTQFSLNLASRLEKKNSFSHQRVKHSRRMSPAVTLSVTAPYGLAEAPIGVVTLPPISWGILLAIDVRVFQQIPSTGVCWKTNMTVPISASSLGIGRYSSYGHL